MWSSYQTTLAEHPLDRCAWCWYAKCPFCRNVQFIKFFGCLWTIPEGNTVSCFVAFIVKFEVLSYLRWSACWCSDRVILEIASKQSRPLGCRWCTDICQICCSRRWRRSWWGSFCARHSKQSVGGIDEAMYDFFNNHTKINEKNLQQKFSTPSS